MPLLSNNSDVGSYLWNDQLQTVLELVSLLPHQFSTGVAIPSDNVFSLDPTILVTYILSLINATKFSMV